MPPTAAPPPYGPLFRDVQGARYHPLPTAQQEHFTGRSLFGLPPL